MDSSVGWNLVGQQEMARKQGYRGWGRVSTIFIRVFCAPHFDIFIPLIFSILQHRAYLAKMQPIWDAEKAEKAAKANRENMIYLAKATGTPIPPDF